MDDPSTYYTPLRMSRPFAPGVAAGGGSAIGLEASADVLLQENGDQLLMESGGSADISAFSAAAALTGAEEWAFVQGGVTVKVTTNQLRTFVNA